MKSQGNFKQNSTTESVYSLAAKSAMPLNYPAISLHGGMTRESAEFIVTANDGSFQLCGTLDDLYGFVGEVIGQLFKWAIKNQKVEWLADQSLVSTSEVRDAATRKGNDGSAGKSS